MKKFKLFALAVSTLLFGTLYAQGPSYGTAGFNDQNYDQVPFASGSASSIMTATNVAGSGWNFHIGAVGSYTITQIDYGTGSYNGAITGTNITATGQPHYYQTFGFSTPSLTKFKLNSVKIRITNLSPVPFPIVVAGVVGTTAGVTTNVMAATGTNWYTVNTSSISGFDYINAVLVINGDGAQNANPLITEIVVDDINISAPASSNGFPVFTSQPTSQTVCTTGSTTFSGTATNAASYFWLMSTDNVVWIPINASNAGTTFSGYNTNTLTVANPSSSLNNLYLMVTATNSGGGNQASYPARLYVTSVNAGTITGGSSVCAGSTLSLSNPTATAGGTWSVTGGRATVNSSGLVTGVSAGSTSVRYSVGSGACAASTTKAITVNALPGTPTIKFAPGTTNISGSGGYCTNKTFTLVGTPSGGSWSSTGVVSITTPGGVVSTGASTGAFSITYTYTNADNCSSSRTVPASVVACRGIGSKVAENNYVVYPNPTKNTVNINLKNIVSNTVATIYNLVGKQVKTQTLSLGNNSIDVSTLAKGIYTISIANGETVKTQKVIVE